MLQFHLQPDKALETAERGLELLDDVPPDAARPEILGMTSEVYVRGVLTLSRGPTAGAVPPESKTLLVRVPVGLSVERLADIFPVESDLARRQVRVGELDLRYRDQVIARLQ